MAFTRLMATSAEGPCESVPGWCSSSWFVVRRSLVDHGGTGALAIVTSTRGDRPGCRCRG